MVDFASPAEPKTVSPIELPDSRGASPLHLYKGTVLTSRWVQSTKNPDKVRFFVDRVDISGSSPVQLASLNTPGSPPRGRGLGPLRDGRLPRHPRPGAEPQLGASRTSIASRCLAGAVRFDSVSQRCISVERDFKLADVDGTRVTLRQTMTPPSQNIAGVQIADDRIYVTRTRIYDYSNAGSSGQPKVLEEGGLWAIGGIRAGQLSIVSEMAGDAGWRSRRMGRGHALHPGRPRDLRYVDAEAGEGEQANFRGWGYSSHVLMSDTRAVASLGEGGTPDDPLRRRRLPLLLGIAAAGEDIVAQCAGSIP